MGSELVVRELPRIRTSGTDIEPVDEDDHQPSVAKPADFDKEQEVAAAAAAAAVECASTPRSEEHVVKPAMVCPPAPRKARPVKRKFPEPPRGFYPVPDDLAAVFVPLSCPASKRIRVA